MITRRRALQLAGAGALALVVPAAGRAAAPPPHLLRSAWLPLVGHGVRVDGAAFAVEAVDGTELAFTVLLRPADAAVRRDGLHRLDHPVLGPAGLFLSPVGTAGAHQVVVDRSSPGGHRAR